MKHYRYQILIWKQNQYKMKIHGNCQMMFEENPSFRDQDRNINLCCVFC